MPRPSAAVSLAIVSLGLLLAGAAPAAGQQAGAPAEDHQSAGPLVIQPIPSSVVLAPAFEVTNVNGATGRLAGGYAGKLIDDTLFVGGGGYWLANPSPTLKMAYGGLVLGWQINLSPRISVGARGLVGVGNATVTTTVGILAEPLTRRPGTDMDANPLTLPSIERRIRFHQDFLVAEPDVNLTLLLTRAVGLTVAGGYRAVGQARGFEHQLQGAMGSVSVQFRIGN
jgi:hypothetical protein